MGLLELLFREDQHQALINLQIERPLFSSVDFYLVGGEMEGEIIKVTKTKNVSQDTPNQINILGRKEYDMWDLAHL